MKPVKEGMCIMECLKCGESFSIKIWIVKEKRKVICPHCLKWTSTDEAYEKIMNSELY